MFLASGPQWAGPAWHPYRHWLFSAQSDFVCIPHYTPSKSVTLSPAHVGKHPRLAISLALGSSELGPGGPQKSERGWWLIPGVVDRERMFALPRTHCETTLSRLLRRRNPNREPEYMPLFDIVELARFLNDILLDAFREWSDVLDVDLDAVQSGFAELTASGYQTTWRARRIVVPAVEAVVECMFTTGQTACERWLRIRHKSGEVQRVDLDFTGPSPDDFWGTYDRVRVDGDHLLLVRFAENARVSIR